MQTACGWLCGTCRGSAGYSQPGCGAACCPGGEAHGLWPCHRSQTLVCVSWATARCRRARTFEHEPPPQQASAGRRLVGHEHARPCAACRQAQGTSASGRGSAQQQQSGAACMGACSDAVMQHACFAHAHAVLHSPTPSSRMRVEWPLESGMSKEKSAGVVGVCTTQGGRRDRAHALQHRPRGLRMQARRCGRRLESLACPAHAPGLCLWAVPHGNGHRASSILRRCSQLGYCLREGMQRRWPWGEPMAAAAQRLQLRGAPHAPPHAVLPRPPAAPAPCAHLHLLAWLSPAQQRTSMSLAATSDADLRNLAVQEARARSRALSPEASMSSCSSLGSAYRLQLGGWGTAGGPGGMWPAARRCWPLRAAGGLCCACTASQPASVCARTAAREREGHRPGGGGERTAPPAHTSRAAAAAAVLGPGAAW